VFIKQARLNGKMLDGWQIDYSDIMNGGVLELEMEP
jgi:putative alpha-1,2-mannosidase